MSCEISQHNVEMEDLHCRGDRAINSISKYPLKATRLHKSTAKLAKILATCQALW